MIVDLVLNLVGPIVIGFLDLLPQINFPANFATAFFDINYIFVKWNRYLPLTEAGVLMVIWFSTLFFKSSFFLSSRIYKEIKSWIPFIG